MPLRIALSDLRTACKQQVDLENHSVISDAEWNRLISRAYAELYNLVFESGLQYFETSVDIASDGTNVLDEPDDHFSTVNLGWRDSAGKVFDLRPLQPQERSAWTGNTGTARRYELVAREFLLYPTPPTGTTFELRYVPQPPDVTTMADDDELDLVVPDGQEFLIWAVAVKACGKTEADPQLAIRERNDARERFNDSVRQRAFYAPRRRIVEFDDEDEDLRW